MMIGFLPGGGRGPRISIDSKSLPRELLAEHLYVPIKEVARLTMRRKELPLARTSEYTCLLGSVVTVLPCGGGGEGEEGEEEH